MTVEKENRLVSLTFLSYLKMGKPQKALEDTDKADKHYRKGMSRIDGLQTSKFLTEEDRDINISQERKRLLKLKVGLMRSRAEALYELSSFERSLIYFHRCEKARPDMAVEFRKGLKKAKNAIGAYYLCQGRAETMLPDE